MSKTINYNGLTKQDTLSHGISTINALATRETQKLVLLFLSMDVVFILLHIAFKSNFINVPLISIERDRGYPEVYQYMKEIWACMLLMILATRRPRLLYISWAVLFFYLLLDDSMQIHEDVGNAISQYLNFQPMLGLRAKDFGEIIVSAISGSIIFGFIGFASLKSDATERKRSMHLFILILLLAFFGIFVDMVHIASPGGDDIWALVEDGGEMIIMSLLLGYIFSLKRNTGKEGDPANA